jgi:UDP-glucose 4-epimerase
MKIMITGGAGFVGSHLCDTLLKTNNEITVLTRDSHKTQNLIHILDRIKFEQVDITDFSKMGHSIERNKPDAIIHLAGETSHSKSFEDPIHDVDVNAKSTLFILEKIRKMGTKCKFVLGSTFIVIGRPTKLPVNEDTPCNPTTIYGINRLSSEYFCRIYHQMYGLDTMVFRITNSFGPREQIIPNKNAINFLIYKAFRGEEVTIYNKGKFYRDIIYISDVVDAIIKILKKGKAGNLYWISSGKKTWFYQLGNMLKELTDAKVKYIETPNYTKKVDVGNFVVDNSKIKELGWTPKSPIKSGIKETLQYFSSVYGKN